MFLALSVIFTYKDLPKTFFQQDEWWTFGSLIFRESGGLINVLRDSFVRGKIHFTPLNEITGYLQFRAFGINFVPYAWTSIVLHIFISWLVFWLFRRITKKSSLSLLGVLLFAVNSIAHQAVSWVAASTNTLGATFFSLLSLVAMLFYVKKRTIKLVYVSLAAAIVALLFKETLFAFLIAPLIVILYGREYGLTIMKNFFLPSIIFLGFYALLRVLIFFVSEPVVLGLTEVQNQPGISVIIYRGFVLAFKAFPQSLIGQGMLLSLSRALVYLAYPTFIAADGAANPYVVETAALDLTCYIVSFLGAVISYVVWRYYRKNQKELGSAIILSLAIIVAGALPIILIPGKGGYVSIIEPRHLYMSTIGASLWFVLVVNAFVRVFLKSKRTFWLIAILIPVGFFHLQTVRSDMDKLKELGDQRRSFLTTVKNAYPSLWKYSVFYVESDSAYYGMPTEETNLPVQSGFGRMLMVWYQEKEKLPGCLFEGVFLHDLIAEGYRNCEGRGFGYARKYETLLRILKDNKLDSDNVIAYSWNGKTKEFWNITGELRMKINKDLKAAAL